MPVLFGWLSTIFTSIFSIFAAWLTARTAAIAAVVAVSLSLTVALFLAIKLLVVGLMVAVTYEPLVMGFWAVWPSNAEACIAACFGADVAVFLYRYKVSLVEALAR
jgi:hypothetical protein